MYMGAAQKPASRKNRLRTFIFRFRVFDPHRGRLARYTQGIEVLLVMILILLVPITSNTSPSAARHRPIFQHVGPFWDLKATNKNNPERPSASHALQLN